MVFEDREDGYTKVRKYTRKLLRMVRDMNKKFKINVMKRKEEKKSEVEKITDTKTSDNNLNSADIKKNNTERFNYFKSLDYDAVIPSEELPRIVAISYAELDPDIYDSIDSRREKTLLRILPVDIIRQKIKIILLH